MTGVEATPSGAAFKLDVSNETLSKTTLGGWRKGRRINLERSLRAGDELGGHLVSGHVDGVAEILSVSSSGFSRIFEIRAPDALAKYIAPKGSVALDGVSLTVNEVEGLGLHDQPHSNDARHHHLGREEAGRSPRTWKWT